MTLPRLKLNSSGYLNLVPTFPKDSIFKNKNFFLLWGAQALTQVGVRLFDFVLAIQIFKVTGSNASVSYLIVAYALPALVFSAIAGVLVDRWNKKGTLILVNLVRALIVLGFIFIVKTFWIILVFAFLLSLVTQFFIPIEGSIIPQIVKRKNLLTANSLFTLTLYTSSVLGFMGAGPLIKAFGDRGAYVVISLMFFTATIFATCLSNVEKKSIFAFLNKKIAPPVSIIKTQIYEGLKLVKSKPLIQKSIILLAFSQTIVGMFMALMPGLAVNILGLQAEDSSLLLIGPAAIGMVLGAVIVSRFGKKVGKFALINTGVFLSAVTFMTMSFIPDFDRQHLLDSFDFTFPINETFMPVEVRSGIVVSSALLALLSGFFNSFIVIPSTTTLQEQTTNKNRGKIYGFLQTVITASGAIPILFAGIAADALGISLVLRIISIIILVCFFIIVKFYGLRSASNK
jgi:MFS family permease